MLRLLIRVLGVLFCSAVLFVAVFMVVRAVGDHQRSEKIATEFGLTSAGADFVLKCVGDTRFGPVGDDIKTSFCGCIGGRIDGVLSDDQIEDATFVILASRTNGSKIPSSSEARSENGRQIMSAIEHATRLCSDEMANGID